MQFSMALRTNQQDVMHAHRQGPILTRGNDVVHLQASHFKLGTALLTAPATLPVEHSFDSPQLTAVLVYNIRAVRYPAHLAAADIEMQAEEMITLEYFHTDKITRPTSSLLSHTPPAFS